MLKVIKCPECGAEMRPDLFQPNITSTALSCCSTDISSPAPSPSASPFDSTNTDEMDTKKRPIVEVSIYVCSNPTCRFRKQILEE